MRITAAGADEIADSATNPELKSTLDNDTSKEWQSRIDQAMSEVGASGEGENPILEAHYDVSRKIRNAAPDDQVRDLGIIAAGQLAMPLLDRFIWYDGRLHRTARFGKHKAGDGPVFRRGEAGRRAV